MPVKRRTSKLKPAVRPEAWFMVFLSGVDHIGDLGPLGYKWGQGFDDDPFRSAAEDAWHEHGHLFIGTAYDQRPPSWAEREFGRP